MGKPQPREPSGGPKGGQFSNASAGAARSKTPSTGFHSTDMENLSSIGKKGLVPASTFIGDDPAVFFNDKLYPVGHEGAIESEGALVPGHIMLKAKIPKRAKSWDDSTIDLDNNRKSFMIEKRIAPADLFVVEPHTRKAVPLKKFLKSPEYKKLQSEMDAADAEQLAKYGKQID